MRPKTYYSQMRLRCPYCQRLFTAEGRSDLSQVDANGIAEKGVYDKLNKHIKQDHRGVKE